MKYKFKKKHHHQVITLAGGLILQKEKPVCAGRQIHTTRRVTRE